MKKTSFFFGIIFSLIGITSQAKDYTLLSPDKHLKVTVTDGNSLLTYSVYHNDSLILKSNQIGLVTLDRQLTAGKVKDSCSGYNISFLSLQVIPCCMQRNELEAER